SSQLLLFIRARPGCPLFPYTTLFRSIRLPAGTSTSFRNNSYVWLLNIVRIRVRSIPFASRRSTRKRLSPSVRFGPSPRGGPEAEDRKSTRLNSSHVAIPYAVLCLKKK